MVAVAEVQSSKSRATRSAHPRSTSRSSAEPTPSLSQSFVRLAGMLGHELKNPLASAITNVAVALEFCDEDDPRRSFLERSSTDLSRITKLIASCLELAKAERPRATSVDIEAFFAAFSSLDVSVDVDVPRGTCVVFDRVLIERAIENLLENARREGATSVLSVRLCAGRLQIRVDDDGPGLSAEARNSAFEPFHSHRGGTGLGLYFVRRVLEAHAGEARLLDGEASRIGASFELSLPLSCKL